MDIVTLDPHSPTERQAWAHYVDSHADATIHHGLPWIDAILSSFSHRPHLLMARRGREIVGVFPAFEVHSVFAGTLLVSVPYGVYGGVLADDDETSDALLGAVRRVATKIHARSVDIRSRQAAHGDLARVDRYVTFVKAIPDSPEAVWQSFPRKARAEARRARDRHGLTARVDDTRLGDVWSLYSRSMRRLGSPNMPRRFFEALLRHLPDRHEVSLLMHEGAPVAGLFSLIHRDTVMPYYSGFDDRARGLGANNYLYVALMERASRRGLRWFDFGRTRVDNSGSFSFKKNQGFQPRPLGYQVLVPAGGTAPNLTPGNPRFQLAQWAWKRAMPLAFTRPLGSWLSASIPG